MMHILSAYPDAMRRYADFSDRSSRGQFWGFYLTLILIVIVLDQFNKVTGLERAHSAAVIAMLLVHAVPGCAVCARRLHDFNRNGWWTSVCFIPFIGNFMAIVIGCIPPTAGGNRYGLPPHGKGHKTIANTFD